MSGPHHEAQRFLLGRLNYERTPARSYGPRKFKLDRMQELMRRLGNPHEGLPIIHIAGTKGKGSTAAMLAAILSAAGYRTGLYTSPHLERIEERMIVDGDMCPPADFVELVQAVRPVAEAMDREARGPTFFELTTAMALLHFTRRRVDAVVLEVGLGGRLDSTNICQPRVSVITNISFDHTRQLGNTLAKIAREKAGIIKPGVPVIVGVTAPEPLREIEQVAAARQSPLRQLGVHFGFEYRPPRNMEDHASCGQMDYWEMPHSALPVHSALEIGLLGRHQAANAAVALAAIQELKEQGWRIDDDAVRRGLAEVRWPARIELLQRHPAIVLDAAHNLASIDALLTTLDESFSVPRRILVFAATHEKDVRAMLKAVLPRFDYVVLTRYVNNPRGVPPEELERLAGDSPTPRSISPNPAAAWEAAREMVGPQDLVCITGSFFLAAEIRAEIAKCPVASCEVNDSGLGQTPPPIRSSGA